MPTDRQLLESILEAQHETHENVRAVHKRLDAFMAKLEDRCRQAHERLATVETVQRHSRGAVRDVFMLAIAAIGWIVAWLRRS